MPAELRNLAQGTGLSKLNEFAARFDKILQHPRSPCAAPEIPAVVEWLRPIRQSQAIDKVVYIIWKDPWMAVSQQTFIGSMLETFIGPNKVLKTEAPYPQFAFENLNEESTLLLFSTEPFPFARKKAVLRKLRFASAIVDGEKWSWFGIRSLRFLETSLPL